MRKIELFILIGIIVPVLILFNHGCAEYKRKKETNEEISERVTRISASFMEKIFNAYRDGNFHEHAKLTTGLLKYYAGHPQLVLYESNKLLLKKIPEEGINPYLSLVLESVHRSAYAPTAKSNQFMRKLTTVLKNYDYKEKIDTESIVVVRTLGRRAYRPYPANAGAAALILMMSEYDGKKFHSSYAPESYIRVASFVNICRKKSLDEENQKEQPLCSSLISILGENFKDTTTASDAFDMVGTLMNAGVSTAASTCLESIGDSTMQDMIDEFDQFTSCIENERPSGPPRFDPFGSLLVGDHMSERSRDLYKKITEQLEEAGFKNTGEVKNMFVPDIPDPGGKLNYYMDYEDRFENPHTKEKAVVNKTTNENGNDIVSVKVQNVNNKGEVISETEITFKDGIPSNASYKDFETGERYRADFNENGTLQREKFVDENGEEHVVEYDKNGKCKSNCEYAGAGESAGTVPGYVPVSELPPAEDYEASQCAAFRTGNLQNYRFDNAVTKLDKLIIPAPDAVEPSDNPCFSQFTSGGIQKCASAVLCLEGYEYDQNCNCKRSARGEVSYASSNCARIICADGYNCDPATGTCVTANNRDFDLGTLSPTPTPYFEKIINMGINTDIGKMTESLRGLSSTGHPQQ